MTDQLFIETAQQDEAQWMPYGYAAMICRRMGISHDAMKVRDLMIERHKDSVRQDKNKTFVKFDIFKREALAYQRARMEEKAAREAAKAAEAARKAAKVPAPPSKLKQLEQQVERLTAEAEELRRRVRALEQIASFRRDMIDRLSQVSA